MEIVEQYFLKRKRETSGTTVNYDLRNLRAVFNFGLHPKRKWIENNPITGIESFPVQKKIKYVPHKEDVLKYFRYHALKHCGASLLDNANVPIGSIQRFLGHENRQTTEIYLDAIGNSERERISVLDTEIKKIHTPTKKGHSIIIERPCK